MQNKKDIFIVLIISVLVISLTFGAGSCKAKDKMARLSGNWNVTMIDDIKLNPEDLLKGLPLIRFDTAEGIISGNMGCNDFTSDAAYTENTIETGELITTKIACPNMEIESQILKILNDQIITFNIDGDTLILANDSGGKLTLISEAEESASTETSDINKIKTLVDSFGKVIVNVSLLSPPDILENDMKKYYGPFLSEELISKWIKNPSEALGRLTSSPWPDHIEIIDLKKITADKYEVSGNVVEITSVEAEQGGYADKFGINLAVERIKDKWLIADVVKGTASDNDATAKQTAIMNDFDELLITEVRSYQVILFIDENINKVSSVNADLMLEKLEHIQKNDRQFYTDLLFENAWQQQLNMIFNRDIEIKDLDEIKDDQLKKIVTEIFDGGFKLIALEGSFYPYIDYESLGNYSGYLTQQYRDYVNIMTRESDKIYSRDAALTISWNELAFRLINCEEFLVHYPEDNIRKKAVGDLYMAYLVSYIVGQNNTPSYSYENNEVKPEVLDSYAELISDYPDHITTNLIKIYQETLTDFNNIIDDQVFGKIDDIYSKAVRSFKLDTPALLLEGIRNTYYQTHLAENGYVVLVNGEYIEKDESDPEKNITIRLSDFTAFGDFDKDGINDAAAILTAGKQDDVMTYSLTLNLNRYFYYKNIPDKIIGNTNDLEIISLGIKDNKIYLNVILNQTEKSMIFGVEDDQFFEY